jgi:hypothetical protein
LTIRGAGDNVVRVSDARQEPGPASPPEDLDRLREELVAARRVREGKEREFEQFVKAFREAPPAARPPEPPRRVPAALVEPPRDARRDRPSGRRVTTVGVVGAAAVLMMAWAWWPGGEVEAPQFGDVPAQGPPATVPEAAPPAAQPAPPSAAQTPAPAAPVEPPAGLNVELTTDRVVWMRVTVDGRQLFEREVPAGEKIPLRGDQRIVVRAGDAGGVRLIVNGRDQGVLGADGQVVTRTLTAPQK